MVIYILAAFILGAFSAIYSLRLGMMWGAAKQQEPGPVNLPLSPIPKPPPKDKEPPVEDKTLQHWFVGGDEQK